MNRSSHVALRITLAAVAAWWIATGFMSYVAGANFGALKVDRIRADDVFGAGFDPAHAELALRYLAGEINRILFTVYGWGQVALAALASVGVLFATRDSGGVRRVVLRACVWISAALALLFLVWLVPTIVEAGQVIDFQPREPVTPERRAFDALHHVSVAVESTKLILLLAAGVLLIRQPD